MALNIESTGFYVMLDGEQTVSHHPTLAEARIEGQKACDAEPIPGTFSIHDAQDNWLEDIPRTDGKGLEQQVKSFNTTVAPANADPCDDEYAYLDQVEKLARTARNATQEAEAYAAKIVNPVLKAQAQQMLDQA